MNEIVRNLFIGITLLVSYCDGLIVPQELPSVLSLVYSNIPPIKKGTDSRFGFGFRLGEHADFQVLVELGPQKYTKPIGKGADDEDSSDTSKRMVDQGDFNKKIKPVNENGNQWLNNWANDMRIKTTMKTRKPQIDEHESFKTLFSAKDQYPLPTAPIIAQSSLMQLQQLYRKQNDAQNESADQSIGTLPSKTMEEHILAAAELKKQQQIKADLSDVSLDK